jgi:hypothetical protein
VAIEIHLGPAAKLTGRARRHDEHLPTRRVEACRHRRRHRRRRRGGAVRFHPNVCRCSAPDTDLLAVGVGDRIALERLDPPTASYPLRFVPFYQVNDEPYVTYFTRG